MTVEDIWALPDEDKGLFVSNRKRAISRMREEFIKSRVPFNALAKHYGVAPSVLRRYADRGSWEEKRAEYSARIFKGYLASGTIHDDAEAFMLKRIEDSALALITRHLEMISRSGEPLGIDELKKVTEIYREAIKQTQLKKGEATNITGTKNYTNVGIDDYNAAVAAQAESDKDIFEDPLEQ